jgi:iron complex outermembrane receptor protein
LLVALAAVPAQAQNGTLSGTVTGSDSGDPLAGAQVQVLGGGMETGGVTGESGQFRFEVPAGSYRLIVTFLGYRTHSEDRVNVGAGTTTNLSIAMVSDVISLNELVVTPSRGVVQKRTEAPATVITVGEQEVAERPTVTPVDHLRTTPGVDIITHGVQATNIVVRGFNNIFSGGLHALTDNRLAGIPSLRVNLLHFIPSTNDDVERMEVVLGPGSALYGPNTSNGVLHIITKSPLDEQGTSLTLGGGEKSVYQAAFRTSHLIGEDFGIKLSGQYLQGNEWVFVDDTEVATRAFARAQPATFQGLLLARGASQSEAQLALNRVGERDYSFERYSGDLRADWRVSDNALFRLNYGVTSASGIELTGIGAGQTDNWIYQFAQARFNYGRFFTQAYLNTSDAGDSFLLRDGLPLVDKSRLFVSQMQYGLDFGDGRQDLTIGGDFYWTNPRSEGTINGINEKDDDVTEYGAYIQSRTELVEDKLDLVLAGRVDKHSWLDDPVYSPRAALVFNADENNSFRVSYNRAFSTPSTLNLFLDINSGLAPEPLGALGYFLRARGPNEGFTFGSGGDYLMRSPFTPEAFGGPTQALPANSSTLWQYGVGILNAQLPLLQQANPAFAAQLGALLPILAGLDPTGAVGLVTLDPVTNALNPLAAGVPDVGTLKESTNTTFEVGYQGVLDNRFLVAADVWYSQRKDFVSPLVLRTPLLLMNGQEMIPWLVGELAPIFIQQTGDVAAGTQAATCAALGLALGDTDCNPATSADRVPGGLATLPLGVVAPDGEQGSAMGPDLLATYVNAGDVNLWGADLALKWLIDSQWTVGGSASWVQHDYFVDQKTAELLGMVGAGEAVEDADKLESPGGRTVGALENGIAPISLNAPRWKGSLQLAYRNVRAGFNAEARLRYQTSFPAESAGYTGTECITGGQGGIFEESCVDDFTLVDVTLGYKIPNTAATLQLAVTNLFDESYRSFVGVPEIGRFIMARIKYDLN